ncbi:basic proline-rich protein-like [Ovis aries]|uniref:basic proline-rich protein-like n=1 Tax=Ovis aries TaxID=9940 RepID=UPI0005FB377C|nr:basic proline-rich protein-like [Ovis aries]
MAALILRPPRGPPPPAPPRPRATPGGTSAGPPPPPAPIGRPRRRSATVRASPAGAPEPHFRDGAWQAGAARPRPGAGGRPHESQSAGCGAGLRAGPGELSSSLPDRETEARLGGDPAAKVTPQARRLGSSRTARTRKPGSEQTPNEATSLVAKLRSVHGSKTRLSSHSCPAPEPRRSELDQVRCGRPDFRAQPGSALSTRLSPTRLLRPQSLHTPAAGSKPTAHHDAECARGLETRHPEDGPEASGGSPQKQPGEASQRPSSAARWPLPPPGGVATRRLRGTGTSLQSLLPTST